MSGILTRILQPRQVERRAVEGQLIESILSSAAYRSTAGVAVTPDSALAYSAIYACARVLAESLASLPLIVYRRLPGGGKERAEDHRLYPILHDTPNPEMTSSEWREACMLNIALWGNNYTQIVHDRAGRPIQLWPQMSRFMKIERDTRGNLIYKSTQPDVRKATLPVEEMLHVRLMSMNGIEGLSPVSLARQGIGLGLATESYGAAFFGNGANPGLTIEHPGTLSDEAYKHLQDSLMERHEGPANAHKTMILEEGMKIEKIGVPPNDAQFLETRRFQISEIARWYRIPPHMIGDMERATFSNIEHQGLDFLIYTLRPWLVRYEQAITKSLMTPAERQVYYVEFLVDSLLRGDIVTRYQSYATARQWGWLSVDDIRAMENLNPVPGGDQYLSPLNMGPLTAAGQPAPKAAPEPGLGADAGSPDEAVRALYPVYREAVDRISRRAVNDITAAARRHLRAGNGSFAGWWAAFADDLNDYATRSLLPVTQAQNALTGCANIQAPGEWAQRFTAELHDWMAETVGAARSALVDPVEAVEDQLKHVDARRVDEWARQVALSVGGPHE